jgi:hyperosmotically inducible protein
MRNAMLGIVALSFAVAGCAGEDARRDEMRDEATTTPTETAPPATEYQPPATADETNTEVNVRDRDGALPTPGDQSNQEGDLQITARIRQAILDDDALSITAENIKIITMNGRVTLRGPVKSSAEKSAIVAKAQQIAGTTQVDDQLEIADGNTGG